MSPPEFPANLRLMICIPCLLVGGTEVHTINLARAMQVAGADVTVCCYYEHDPITVNALRRLGVAVELLGLDRQSGGSAGRGLLRGVALAKALTDCIHRLRPDVVHVQYMAPGALPLIIARAAGVPYVVATVHVTANHYGRRSWLPRKVGAPLCDAFLCVSGVAEHSFFGRSSFFTEAGWREGRRHFTIHNCVDLPAIDAALAEYSLRSVAQDSGLGGRPVIGIVGRLDRFKGHDVLLEAVATVRRDVPDVVLLCVGDGALREQLHADAFRLGLKGHVVWAGRMSQADVYRHVLSMDVVAMPSRPGLEGFGLAAAEAMALGKPVVVSDVDGLSEVAGRDGAALLVPPEDPGALAAALRHLLASPDERHAVGQAARHRVERLFSPGVFADRHVSLYRSLCGNPRSPILNETPECFSRCS